MSGFEIIDWAVKKCEKAGLPPTDSALIRMIREHGHADVDRVDPSGCPEHGRRAM